MNDLAAIVPPKRKMKKLSSSLVIIVVLLLIIITAAFSFFGEKPPAPNIVATFDGGQITADDVISHRALILDKDSNDQPIDYDILQTLTEEMIADEIARRWGTARKVDNEKKISHLLSHVDDEINLDAWHQDMHQGGMGISENDISAYFNANRSEFGERSLSEVRTEIENKLKEQGEDKFVDNYIAGIKANADIRRNYEVLNVPAISSEALSEYYDNNQTLFETAGRLIVNQVRIQISPKESEANNSAIRIIDKIRSGTSMSEAIIDETKNAELYENVVMQKGGSKLAETIDTLDVGQLSEPIRDGDFYYIIQVLSKENARLKPLSEVKNEVISAVSLATQTAWFEQNKDNVVFSIDGDRITAGDFWTEYRELPEPLRQKYSGQDGLQALAEKLIVRYLISKENSQEGQNADKAGISKEARAKLLSQMMEKEEIDDKVKVREEEISAYYDKNRKTFVVPPKSQILQIRIRVDANNPKSTEAQAAEAYKSLVPGPFRKALDFKSVAAKFDTDAVEKGGVWDDKPIWVGEERYIFAELGWHEYHEKVLAIKPGTIGTPFIFGDSTYIIKVLDRNKARQLPLAEVKEYINEQLIAKKHDELAANLSKRLFKEYNVRIFDSSIRSLATKMANDRTTKARKQ
jgi:parvulin-like peptidyl-prolyl isomerase